MKKRCTTCPGLKDLDEFTRVSANSEKRRHQCKKCINIYLVKRYRRIHGPKRSPLGRTCKHGGRGKYTSITPDDAVEFSAAMDKFKKDTHTRFPSWTEALEVVKKLGYRKC